MCGLYLGWQIDTFVPPSSEVSVRSLNVDQCHVWTVASPFLSSRHPRDDDNASSLHPPTTTANTTATTAKLPLRQGLCSRPTSKFCCLRHSDRPPSPPRNCQDNSTRDASPASPPPRSTYRRTRFYLPDHRPTQLAFPSSKLTPLHVLVSSERALGFISLTCPIRTHAQTISLRYNSHR